MTKLPKKKVTKKNYLIVGVIYLVIILLVLYFASWYNTYQEYQKEIPVLRNTVFEIKPEEVEHYLLENPSCVLYLCVASDEECRSFEVNFKKTLARYDWQNAITYVNINLQSAEKEAYLTQLLATYGNQDMVIQRTPALLAFDDGKLVAVESGLNGAALTIHEAVKFMDVYRTGE